MIDFCTNVSDTLFDDAENYLHNLKYYVPSLRNGNHKETDMFWIYKVFNLKFVYWEKENLIALCGNEFPDSTTSLFDTFFEFQNSTDQDYEYNEWSDKIKIFAEKKKYYMELGEETLVEKLGDDIEEDLEHFRKELLYNDIFESLNLDEWLYNRKSDSFIRFGFCPIDSSDKLYSLYQIFLRIKNLWFV